jgi:dTDP-4-dehydrorhamnose 3,5-epimerase
MNISTTEIPGVIVLEPRVFRDSRGLFQEMYHRNRFSEAGINVDFVQDNLSRSCRGTLRGLHYQIKHPQGKLCQAIRGEVFDVVLDLRRHSSTFGRWTSFVLTETNHRQLYVPPGLAHGYCALSATVDFLYKCTDYYYPEHERTIRWDDPQLAVAWPVPQPLLSEKDRLGLSFAEAPYYEDL